MSQPTKPLSQRQRMLTWHIRRHLLFTFEMPSDILAKALPPELTVFESSPGLGLLDFGWVDYHPGNFGAGSQGFNELIALIHVPPDLSIDMPVPKMAYYVVNVGTDSPDFVEREKDTVRTPAHLLPELQVKPDADGLGVTIGDARGTLGRIRNTHDAPKFGHEKLHVQFYTEQNDALYFGIAEWEGLFFEHQRGGDAGGPQQHPFFKNLELAGVEIEPYHQMLAQPGGDAYEYFYELERLR